MEMRLRREIAALPSLLAMSEEFCRLNDVQGRDRETVDVVLEELFTNAVKYGSNAVGEILVVLGRNESELHLSLTDFDSEHFDIRDSPDIDIDRPLEDRSPGGLGIHLIRKLTDRIEYHHHERISRITVYKTLE